jgi:hypothetical protein
MEIKSKNEKLNKKMQELNKILEKYQKEFDFCLNNNNEMNYKSWKTEDITVIDCLKNF